MTTVEVSHLAKQFGEVTAVSDVSFTVEEGEIYGFIGPNGAGKSTTIRLFLSLIFPSSGRCCSRPARHWTLPVDR